MAAFCHHGCFKCESTAVSCKQHFAKTANCCHESSKTQKCFHSQDCDQKQRALIISNSCSMNLLQLREGVSNSFSILEKSQTLLQIGKEFETLPHLSQTDHDRQTVRPATILSTEQSIEHPHPSPDHHGLSATCLRMACPFWIVHQLTNLTE